MMIHLKIGKDVGEQVQRVTHGKTPFIILKLSNDMTVVELDKEFKEESQHSELLE